ncbi:MAG: hypothetical protein WD004_00055 [Actinomycetota bacterium]
MKRWMIAAIAAGMGVAAALGVAAVAATAPVELGPPALHDETVPRMPLDLGVGERLILVVDGVYDTQGEAEEAAAALSFGELQGFYVAQINQFAGLREAVGSTGSWALVSSFRTQEGAEEFAALAQAAGADPVITPRVQSLPGVFTGLGQEARPDGRGPLTVSVPASAPTEVPG